MIIKNEKRKKAILNSLADEEMLKILNFTQKESRSAVELIKKHDISHSTAYRKIKWLLDSDILVVDKMELKDDGKKSSLLKNTLKAVDIKYNDNKVTVIVEENVRKIDLTARQFLSME